MFKILFRNAILVFLFLSLTKSFAMSSTQELSEKRIILIEGIAGSFGANLLTPEILKLNLKDNRHIIFYGTDFKNNLTAKGEQALQKLAQVGMIFIDKSDPKALAEYQNLRPDYVYLATPPHTHIPLARSWLKKDKPPKVIYVEKPFTQNIQEMRDFVADISNNTNQKTKVYAIDHAIAFSAYGDHWPEIHKFLGKVSTLSFFWTHNHSGNDKTANLIPGEDRPFSRSIRKGVIPEENRSVYDTLTHFLIPASEFANPTQMKITDIKAAQYETAEIPDETFVATRLVMQDKQYPDNTIAAMLYAGAGVDGIDSLGIKSLAHLLILRNKSGKEVHLSLDDYTATFINQGKIEKTLKLPKIYSKEMVALFRGEAIGDSPQFMLQCLEILAQITQRIGEYQKQAKLPVYRLGRAEIPAPSLEEILRQVPRIYGNNEDLLLGQELKASMSN